MADVRDQCAVHEIVINRIDDKLSSVICKLDGIDSSVRECITCLAKNTIRIDHLEKSDQDQWKALHEMRKIVYKAVGMAIGLMAIVQVLFHYFKRC